MVVNGQVGGGPARNEEESWRSHGARI
jgi:hypothetical protein